MPLTEDATALPASPAMSSVPKATEIIETPEGVKSIAAFIRGDGKMKVRAGILQVRPCHAA